MHSHGLTLSKGYLGGDNSQRGDGSCTAGCPGWQMSSSRVPGWAGLLSAPAGSVAALVGPCAAFVSCIWQCSKCLQSEMMFLHSSFTLSLIILLIFRKHTELELKFAKGKSPCAFSGLCETPVVISLFFPVWISNLYLPLRSLWQDNPEGFYFLS